MTDHHESESAQIQQDAENTRSQLDDTLTAIERRLAPGQLLEDGMDYLRNHGGREYLVNLSDSVKREPIPLALVGVGLAWMMMSSKRQRSQETLARDYTQTAGSGNGADVAATLRDKATAATAKVSDLASQTSTRVAELAQGARTRARQAGDTVREGAERARGGYDYLVNEQPLALGAIGFALGVLLASAAPRSTAEDRLVGDTSDRIKDDIGERGREQVDRLAEAASEAVKTKHPPVPSSSNLARESGPLSEPLAAALGRPAFSAPDTAP